MEKELKTLKDLDNKYDDQDNCGYIWNMGDVYFELRSIAKEWVKALNKSRHDWDNPNNKLKERYDYSEDIVINFINDFFNLEVSELVSE